MQSPKHYMLLLVLVLLVGMFSFSTALSSISNSYIIRSSGEILPLPQSTWAYKDTFRSEVRGILIHTPFIRTRDWDVIAQTCLSYGFNTAVIETYLTDFWANGKVADFPELRTAIEAFHDRGLKVHILVVFGLTPPEQTMRAETAAGVVDWLCFTKQSTRQALRAISDSLARNYDLDGIMFDYVRYSGFNICLCSECKQKFINDTGLADVEWPTDVLEGGRYFWNFTEWRMIPVTAALAEFREIMLSIRSNLLFSAAVFPAFDGCGNWQPMYLGQHAADWVDKGLLDFICPMPQTGSPNETLANLNDSCDFYVGGFEGKIPCIPYLYVGTSATDATPVDDFVDVVRGIHERGGDGWILWRYGGPGLSGTLDIEPYIAALNNQGLIQPTWDIQNFSVIINEESTEATISWTTTVPTGNRIEYANKPIFVGELRYNDNGRPFHYKNVNYVGGTIVEDPTLKTVHSFTIPVTAQTEFRIQSTDENGVTVTSSPMSVLEAAR